MSVSLPMLHCPVDLMMLEGAKSSEPDGAMSCRIPMLHCPVDLLMLEGAVGWARCPRRHIEEERGGLGSFLQDTARGS